MSVADTPARHRSFARWPARFDAFGRDKVSPIGFEFYGCPL